MVDDDEKAKAEHFQAVCKGMASWVLQADEGCFDWMRIGIVILASCQARIMSQVVDGDSLSPEDEAKMVVTQREIGKTLGLFDARDKEALAKSILEAAMDRKDISECFFNLATKKTMDAFVEGYKEGFGNNNPQGGQKS